MRPQVLCDEGDGIDPPPWWWRQSGRRAEAEAGASHRPVGCVEQRQRRGRGASGLWESQHYGVLCAPGGPVRLHRQGTLQVPAQQVWEALKVLARLNWSP